MDVRSGALAGMSVSSARGANFSFTGSFVEDDDIQLFYFTLEGPSSAINLLTLGYAGGTNAAGTIIPDGGFDPVLSLFVNDGPGTALGLNDNDIALPIDPTTNASRDSRIQTTLPAGEYILVLTQSGNTPLGELSEGFSREGEGDFTGPMFTGNPGSFIDANVAQRNALWAVELRDVVSAAIPEPATAAICALPLMWSALRRRRPHRELA